MLGIPVANKVLANYVSLPMQDYILKFTLFAAAFLCAGYVIGGFITNRREARARKRVSRVMTRAYDAVEVLKQQLGLISNHSQEYFHTLVLADFPALQAMVDVLDTLLRQAELFVEDGDLVHALALSSWILDPKSNPAPAIKSISKEQRDIVSNWIPRSRELLIGLADALEVAHAENIDSGVKRVRKDRRPTELDLRRLRENLLFSGR